MSGGTGSNPEMAGNIEIRPDSKYYMELSRLVLSPNEEVMKDALDEPADTRTRIWLLHEELCQKASRYAKLAQQPMDNFYVSRAELKELDSDKERLVLLMMKIHTVDDLLAAGQGPAAAPSGPSEMASRSTTTVAQILSCPDQHVDPNQDPKAAKQQSEQKGKRKIWNLDTYMEIYNKHTAATSSGAPAVLKRPAQSTDPFCPLDL